MMMNRRSFFHVGHSAKIGVLVRGAAAFAVCSGCTAGASEPAESAESASVSESEQSAPYRVRLELPEGLTLKNLKFAGSFRAEATDGSSASSTTLIPGQSVAVGAAAGCVRMPSLNYSKGFLDCSFVLDAANETVVHLSKLDRLFGGELVAASAIFPLSRLDANDAEHDTFDLSTFDLASGVLLAGGRYSLKLAGAGTLEMVVPEGNGAFRPNLDPSALPQVTTVRPTALGAPGQLPDASVDPAIEVVAEYGTHEFTVKAPLRGTVPVFVLPSELRGLQEIRVEAFGESLRTVAVATDPQSVELVSFTFRAVLGLILTLIYVARGFAAAVWTHALYDVWVLVFR